MSDISVQDAGAALRRMTAALRGSGAAGGNDAAAHSGPAAGQSAAAAIADPFAEVFARMAVASPPPKTDRSIEDTAAPITRDGDDRQDDHDEVAPAAAVQVRSPVVDPPPVDRDDATHAARHQTHDRPHHDDPEAAATPQESSATAQVPQNVSSAETPIPAAAVTPVAQTPPAADADPSPTALAPSSAEQPDRRGRREDAAAADPSAVSPVVTTGDHPAADADADAAETTAPAASESQQRPTADPPESSPPDRRRGVDRKDRDDFTPRRGDQDASASAGSTGSDQPPSAPATIVADHAVASPATSGDATSVPASGEAAAAPIAAPAAVPIATAGGGGRNGATAAGPTDVTAGGSATPAAGKASDAKTARPEGKNGSNADILLRAKLVQRVSRAFQHIGGEGGSIRLRLSPEQLGSVQLDMQVQDKQVAARIVADSEVAAQLLREQLPELRSRLESQGLRVEQIEIEVDPSRLNSGGSNDPSSRQHRDGTQETAPTPWSPRRSGRGGGVKEPVLAPTVTSASTGGVTNWLY